MTTQEAWQRQRELLEEYKINCPELITPIKSRTEHEIFKEIGISNLPPNRPNGYLRLYFSDFLVEEKTRDNEIIKLTEITNSETKKEAKTRTLYANLIKIGITTNTAADRISEALDYNGIIGYAGLKDDRAITAQLLALPKIKKTIEEIKSLNIPNLFLSNLHWGKGTIKPGYLAGNFFTIVVRTENEVKPDEYKYKLANLERFGFLNYFQSQRFGGQRLIGHKIGKLILQCNYELAIRYFLFKTNQYEMPLIANLKKQAEKIYPDYKNIIKLFNQLPYSFLYELRILEYLKDQPKDFIGALSTISDNITICLYAYASLLFNRYLSDQSERRGVVNERFPLLMSSDPADVEFYKDYLKKDQITDIYKALSPFKFVYWAKRDWAGRIFPKNLSSEIFHGGIVISFFLPKGAYATTLLANLFVLFENEPVPAWVNKNEIDAKQLLNQGSIAPIRAIFNDCWLDKSN